MLSQIHKKPVIEIKKNITNTLKKSNIKITKIKKYCFIITRHVNSEKTNKYWIESYNCIRTNYGNNIKIIIIDDNSNYFYIDKDFQNKIINTEIVQSEYIGRGELLPYYYFYKNKYADYAIIIHDSVFIQKYIDFFEDTNINVKFMWHFDPYNRCVNGKIICALYHDDPQNEKNLLMKLNDNEQLLSFYDEFKWRGCFGVMSVISHDFITNIKDKHNFFILLNFIKTRTQRCYLERVFSVLCHFYNRELTNDPSFFKNIFNYIKWETTYDEYKSSNIKKDIIKVWSGR